VTLIIEDRRVGAFVTAAAQRVLNRLGEGRLDQPEDGLLSGIAQAIEEVLRSSLPPSAEVWNRA
jgi:hypothetical protein